jgi:tetratricopeptide (TPR) repeat protein/transcriptional regulator with XRE-family HTH domain
VAPGPASDGGAFGDLLRRHRAAANLTQEELSERSGVSVHAISMLERGVRRAPRPSTIESLAGALGLVPADRDALVAAARGQPAEPVATAAATRTLPRDVAAFTGRRAELDRLLAAATSGAAPAIIAIDGMAGIGKTAFAVHAAHGLATEFPDGQHFLDLHGHAAGRRPVTPAEALGTLLLAIGVHAQLIPPDVDGRAALWRDRLAGARMLVLLDDAAGQEQVRPLLPGSPGCLVLVTSRRRLAALEDVEPLSLGTLPAAQAAELFSRLAGAGGEPAAIAEIVERCGGLPLAIGLLAGRLRSHPSWSARYLADTLRDAQDRLAEMYAGDRSVGAALDLSYRDLPAAERRLFRRLGLHPGPDIDAYAAAALDDIDLATARRRLDSLYTDHLVDEPMPGRYRLHDLVRARARALASDDDGEAAGRLLDYYLHATAVASRQVEDRASCPVPAIAHTPVAVPDLSSRQRALAWMEAERDNLGACFDHAVAHGQAGHAVHLSRAAHVLLRLCGHWDQALAMHRAALDVARRVQDRRGEAGALEDLGRIQRYAGQFAAATASLTEAMGHFRDLGDRLGEASGLTEIAKVREMTGEHAAAHAMWTDALATYRAAGDRAGQARVLVHLGEVLSETGDRAAAGAALAEALAIHRELGDRHGEALGLVNLGQLHYLTGAYAEAIAVLTQSRAMFRDLGDRRGEANALGNLGRVRRQTGEYAAAIVSLSEVLTIFRDLRDLVGQATALNHLGVVQRASGDHGAATASLVEALAINGSLRNDRGRANTLNSLGVVQRLAGDHEAATASLTEALALFRQLDNRRGEANVLQDLGVVQHATGEPAAAGRSMTAALALFRDLGDRRGTAEALNDLGALELATTGHHGAIDRHREALELAREIGSPLQEARALEGIGRCLARGGAASEGAARLRRALEVYRRLGAPEAERVVAALRDLDGVPEDATVVSD